MKNKIKVLLAALTVGGFLVGAQALFAETYDIDGSHSTIGFAVKHLMVSTVRGSFTDYKGQIEFDGANLDAFKADVTIQVKSINTSVEARDNHLRSPDFFDAEAFPAITFVGKKLEAQGDGYVLTGDLTIRDVTKEIAIPVSISGPVKTPFGSDAIGLSGEITINRQDYGVKWSKALDSGGMVVEDNVKLLIDLEAHHKAAEEKK